VTLGQLLTSRAHVIELRDDEAREFVAWLRQRWPNLSLPSGFRLIRGVRQVDGSRDWYAES